MPTRKFEGSGDVGEARGSRPIAYQNLIGDGSCMIRCLPVLVARLFVNALPGDIAMRTIKSLAVIGATLALAGVAHAAEKQDSGFYVHGSLGVIQPNASTANYSAFNPALGYSVTGSTSIGYQVGMAGTAGLGYRVNRVLRLETEFDYGSSKVTSGGSATMVAGYVAAYADIPVGVSVLPYVGAGIGFGQTRMTGITTSGLSAFAEVGLGIPVTDSVTISPAARFLWLNNGNAYVADSTAWMGRLAVRWSF